jgi:transcriptional regulator with XRE-family HTH domain
VRHFEVVLILVPQLAALRRDRALTQEELADKAGVSLTTVRRGESGKSLRQSSVRKLARALKVSTTRLQRTG